MMTAQEPPAETVQHQESLFQDPLNKFYAAQDAYEEECKMVKEKEAAMPEHLQELHDSYKEMKKQFEEAKEQWIEDLKDPDDENYDEEYVDMVVRKTEAKIQLDEFKSDLRVLAIKESQTHELELTIMVDDAPVRLQTQKNTDLYLNGELLK